VAGVGFGWYGLEVSEEYFSSGSGGTFVSFYRSFLAM